MLARIHPCEVSVKVFSKNSRAPVTARIAFRAMNMPCPSDLAPDEGQPYRLSLLHALATTSNDPDLKLVPVVAEGVPTGAVSELPRSMPQADLPSELTECIGNWKAAEAEPETVSALLERKLQTDGSLEPACPLNKPDNIGIKA